MTQRKPPVSNISSVRRISIAFHLIWTCESDIPLVVGILCVWQGIIITLLFSLPKETDIFWAKKWNGVHTICRFPFLFTVTRKGGTCTNSDLQRGMKENRGWILNFTFLEKWERVSLFRSDSLERLFFLSKDGSEISQPRVTSHQDIDQTYNTETKDLRTVYFKSY